MRTDSTACCLRVQLCIRLKKREEHSTQHHFACCTILYESAAVVVQKTIKTRQQFKKVDGTLLQKQWPTQHPGAVATLRRALPKDLAGAALRPRVWLGSGRHPVRADEPQLGLIGDK